MNDPESSPSTVNDVVLAICTRRSDTQREFKFIEWKGDLMTGKESRNVAPEF